MAHGGAIGPPARFHWAQQLLGMCETCTPLGPLAMIVCSLPRLLLGYRLHTSSHHSLMQQCIPGHSLDCPAGMLCLCDPSHAS